jgi:hypothetical protein
MTNNFGVIFIALYVDDCLCIGHKKVIKNVIKGMESQGLTFEVEDMLTDFLSCQIVFSADETQAWIGQPHLIKMTESGALPIGSIRTTIISTKLVRQPKVEQTMLAES